MYFLTKFITVFLTLIVLRQVYISLPVISHLSPLTRFIRQSNNCYREQNVFKHQDWQMFGRNLNEYEYFYPLEVVCRHNFMSGGIYIR